MILGAIQAGTVIANAEVMGEQHLAAAEFSARPSHLCLAGNDAVRRGEGTGEGFRRPSANNSLY
jgi:hypothetical protein